ncbi:AraC family transcriptional regulator [Pseudomonas alkylphenolica]|uniref:AraC family transcriptional regulator n=1 Tax=Pseudomonas alkylphenolica TaxID=237609 RepID=UPI0018D7F3EB|nr:AraC family transcriptional regulator [Pseudomonas alkylphenolica]MBH3426689.1 AraC family transcriptional regulator [Pseudomonas alkylphenolica]
MARDQGSLPPRVVDAPQQAWMVPAINVLLVRDMLKAENVSELELLRGTGTSPRDIQSNDALLTFDQVTSIMANAARLTRTPGLGLIIGSHESLSDWGTLGYALLSCVSIGEAIRTILKFHQTAASMVEIFLIQEGSLAILDLSPPKPLHTALPLILEEHLVATKKLLELLAEKAMPMVQLNLGYDRPNYHRLYQRYFDCPVLFASSRNQLIFEASFLEQPISRSNPFGAKLAQQVCNEQLARQICVTEFLTQVRNLILLSGNDFPSAEQIAAKLNITSRTLRNRLKHHGTSFQSLLDATRKQLSCSYLSSTRIPIDDIARLLNFSDRSNFRRAFKAWVGVTPSEYRQQQMRQRG